MTGALSFTWTPGEPELLAWGTVSEDFNPLHFDDDYCRQSVVGQRVVFGALALARLQAATRREPADLPVRVSLRFTAAMPVGSELGFAIEGDVRSANCSITSDGRPAAVGSVGRAG